MTVGVFVVGALREIELCSKSWQVPYPAEWHLLTWSTATDRFLKSEYSVKLDGIQKTVEFQSMHVYNKTWAYSFGDADKSLKWALQGPWFWNQVYTLYPDYDHYIILRPDLFLWPVEGRGWPEHLPNKLWTLGPRQDQMFMADNSGMSFLAGAYHWIAMNADKCKNIHDYLGEYFSPHGLDMGVDHDTLRQAFHYTLARPNSREFDGPVLTKELANGVFWSTAQWWKNHTGQEYQGMRLLP